MSIKKSLIAQFLMLVVCGSAMAGLPSTKVTFDNGFQAIFVENHSSPMITSVVFVNAGARYETEYNNGATHFLEHLLFDGTRQYTQEQLSDLVDRHGGYINAFTRKDLTSYLVLMPTQYIDYGLEAQSEQLFYSILPEDKIDKERRIVIEEIRQDDDDPDYRVEKFDNSVVFAGTPYARPVLGYEQLIANMPRDMIVDYYHKYYVPNNMIALVIGDFDTKDFISHYATYFGAPPRKELPMIPEVKVQIPVGKKIVRTQLDTKQCYVNVTSQAPQFSDPDYYPFYILNELLNNESTSPLIKALKSGDQPLAQSVGASIYTQKDFTTYEISMTCDSAANVDPILKTLNQTMEQTLVNWEPRQSDIDAILVSEKTNEIYLREKLHYYGFMVAPLMVATGYDFVDNLVANIEKVKAADVKRVAQRFFKDYSYVATVVTPRSNEAPEAEAGFTSKYLDRTLPNGLEVIIKSNPYSEVEAFMVLGKDRNASEPAGKAGITDFVNRMLDEGTTDMDKDQISHKLQSIGANLTSVDNPYIPYDDRYTSPLFSFIKFETIKDYTDDGIAVLADMIKNPTFPEAEVGQVRGEMMQVLGMKSGSTYQQARDLFYDLLFNGTSLANPLTGTQRTVGSITRDDLVAYHHSYYAPNNMILSICTDVDPETMYQKIVDAFGDMTAVESNKAVVTTVKALPGEVTDNVPMESKQTYFYLGGPVCSISDPDAVPLQVAVDILSTRLGDNLREKQGLAYRVGAGVSFDRDFGWFAASMGTGTQNFDKAKAGMLAEIEGMKTEPVTADELEKAVNSIWGSMLTARLSRINQAFYMAVNQFLGRGYDYEDNFIQQLDKVTPEDVQRVAAKYLDTANYVLATVGAPSTAAAVTE